jgi:hypothetical protein
MREVSVRGGLLGLFSVFLLSISGCAETLEEIPSQPQNPNAVARSSTSAVELAPALAQKVRTAEEIGQYLVLQDLLAARGNEVIEKDPTLGEDAQRQGWIIVQDDRCTLVRFFGQNGDQYTSLYDVCFRLASMARPDWVGEIIKYQPPQVLPPVQQQMVRARQLAIASLTERCSDQYRLVMLSGNMDNQKIWAVYLIPSSKHADAVMVGGHTMMAISEDGTQVLRNSQLSKCLELPAPSGVPLTTSELISETPTELHVYLNRMRNAPIYVGTRGGLWKITHGQISLLEGLFQGSKNSPLPN